MHRSKPAMLPRPMAQSLNISRNSVNDTQSVIMSTKGFNGPRFLDSVRPDQKDEYACFIIIDCYYTYSARSLESSKRYS